MTMLLAMLQSISLMGQSKPNIIWIVSEDNSMHFMRMFFEGGAAMPHLEDFAKDAIVFRNAFSQAPVCSVARSTLISGCYASRIGAQYHRREKLVPMPKDLKMFPAYLQDHGYYTSNNSKEDYNLIKSEDVWHESSRSASYRNRAGNQPFFHVQNFGTTHESRLHFPAADVDTLPTKTNPKHTKPHPHHPDTRLFRYTYARYHDQHQKVDQQIGHFIQQLKDDGVYESSIIFYYGDHGGVLPGSKGYIYERGLHVPLLVRVPAEWQHLVDLEPGTKAAGFVRFIDLGPTVLHLAGAEVPEAMDGEPFIGPEVSRLDLDRRNQVFGYADRFDEKYDLVRSMRIGKFKYIRNYQPFNVDALQNNYRYINEAFRQWRTMYDSGELNEEQAQFFQARSAEALYNIEKDPFELNNLADEPEFEGQLRLIRSELQKQVKSMPDLSFIPEPIFVADGSSDPVAFGQEQKGAISRLIDISDLSLQPWKSARKRIREHLTSKHNLERYWAYIVLSSFGKQSTMFEKRVKRLIEKETDRLAKLRALEFLGLLGNNVGDRLRDLLKTSEDQIEANLILNTIVLLRDHYGLETAVRATDVPESWLENRRSNVTRRIHYLTNQL